MPVAASAALSEKERLINDIMRNVCTTADLHRKISEGDKRKETLEVEADALRWLAVGQAAATKLLEALQSKGFSEDVKNEGDLLARMNIPPERLQWSAEDEAFY